MVYANLQYMFTKCKQLKEKRLPIKSTAFLMKKYANYLLILIL